MTTPITANPSPVQPTSLWANVRAFFGHPYTRAIPSRILAHNLGRRTSPMPPVEPIRREELLEGILTPLERINQPVVAQNNWDDVLRHERDVFAKKASIYSAVWRIEQILGHPLPSTVVFEIIKEGSTPNPLTNQTPELISVVRNKDFFRNLSWIQQQRCRFTCGFVYNVIYQCTDQFSRSFVEGIYSQVLSNADQSLTRLGFELSKILSFHFGKYLKAIETFSQSADAEGDLSHHISLAMKNIRDQTEKEIFSDFSKVIVDRYLPSFPFVESWKNSPSTFWYILGNYLLWPIDLLLNGIYKLLMKYWILPNLFRTLVTEASIATQFKPFAHAINCTFAKELRDLKRWIIANPDPAPSTGQDFLDETTKQNLGEAIAKLLKILQTEPYPTRQEIGNVLTHGETETEIRARTLDRGSRAAMGKSLDQLTNEALQQSITEIVVFGFNYFLKPEKVKQLLAVFMGLANAPFEREMPQTEAAWNLWSQEYTNKKNELFKTMDEIIEIVVRRETSNIAHGSIPLDQVNTRLQRETTTLKAHTRQMLQQLQDQVNAITTLTPAGAPSELLKKIDDAKTTLENHVMPLYSQNLSHLSEESQQNLHQATTALYTSMQYAAHLLTDMKDKQTKRSLHTAFQKTLAIVQPALTQAMTNILTNPAVSFAQLNEINQQLQEIAQKHTTQITDANGMIVTIPEPTIALLRQRFEELNAEVQRVHLQNAAIANLESLRTPIFTLAALMKNKILTGQAIPDNQLAIIRAQIQTHLQQIQDTATRTQLETAIFALLNCQNLPALDPAWINLRNLHTQIKTQLEGARNNANLQFQQRIQEWNTLAAAQGQVIATNADQAHNEFQQLLTQMQAELTQLGTEAQNIQAPSVVPTMAASIGRSVGGPLLGGIGGAVAGGMLGGPLGLVAGAVAGEELARRTRLASIPGSWLGRAGAHVIGEPVQEFAAEEINNVVLPKVMKRVSSGYRILQKREFWEGLTKIAMQNFSHYFKT